MAKEISDGKRNMEPTAPSPDAGSFCSGRIGTSHVFIYNLPPQAGHVEAAARDLKKRFQGVEILVTGLGSAPADYAKPGDLIIGRAGASARAEGSQPAVLEGAIDVLRREVGEDGRWLSNDFPGVVTDPTDPSEGALERTVDGPRLHYRKVAELKDQESMNEPAARDVQSDLSVMGSITVLGVVDGKSDRITDVVAARVASYARELIHLSTLQSLAKTIPDVQGTEDVTPPPVEGFSIPQFETHQYPIHGNAVLLVIPTANKMKVELLQSAVRAKAPDSDDVHTITIPADSCVGEQPYNRAGIIGAHNRISNALRALREPKNEEIFRSKQIGTVLVASIESYFETERVGRPTDYGVVVIHNATTGGTTACLSQGTMVPPAYVDRARHFGFEGDDPRFGRVTVGRILAAHIPGLDKADWQVVLGGHSRYELLKDAVERLEIPWGLG